MAVMLAANPAVGLATISSFTDPAGRRFVGGISGLQYALWSLDLHLWSAMLRVFEATGGETLARARAQVLTVSASVLPWQREHGRVFDFAPILRAYERYDEGKQVWKGARRFKHWATVIGMAQRRAPAHVLQEFCRRDRPLAPPPDFSATDPGDSLHLATTTQPVCSQLHDAAGKKARAGSPPPPPPPSVTPSRDFDCRYERRAASLPQAAATDSAHDDVAAGSSASSSFAPPLPDLGHLEVAARRVSLPRERLDWLLTEQHEGGGLGGTWALIRGHGDLTIVTPSSWRAQIAIAGTSDAVALRALAAARTAQFEQLVSTCRPNSLSLSLSLPETVRMGGEGVGKGWGRGGEGMGAGRIRGPGAEEGRQGGLRNKDGGRLVNFVMHTPRKRGSATNGASAHAPSVESSCSSTEPDTVERPDSRP